MSVEVQPWTDWPRWAEAWGELADSSGSPSFFLTREWVEAWLDVFGPTTKPRILTFREGPGRAVIGLCLLVLQSERKGPFRIRRAYLNTAGEPEADDAYAEYNSLLCRAGREEQMAAAFGTYLREQRWDEFVARGMSPGPPLDSLLRSLGRLALVRREVPSHFVDLRNIPVGPESYLSALSRNTRGQVRRSQRALESRGPLEIRAAADLSEARRALEELSALHTASWNARGKPGVFASARFREFHERLVQHSFPLGRIQLLRVRAGEQTLAVLYNFVYRGKAWFYQSGLRLEEDKRVKSGMVAHMLAIEHCRESGLLEYDFLAGDDQYKRSLATGSRPMTWLVFRRAGLKLRTIDALRTARRTLGQRR